MADSNSKDSGHTVFTPYQWGREFPREAKVSTDVLMRFAEKVSAIADGSEVILKIAEARAIDADLRDETDPPPYFNNNHIGTLLRMVQMNMNLLSQEAEHLNEWAYEVHTPEGRASRYESAVNSIKWAGERLPRMDD